MQRREPAAVEIGREDAALIAHQRRQRQRLAAGTRTEIDHGLARSRSSQRSDQLRALVLDLELAGEEGGLALQRRPAAVGTGLEAQRIRRPGSHFGLEMSQRGAQRVPPGLETVRPDVDRRPLRERLALGDGMLGEGLDEGRPEPFRDIGADPARGGREIEGGEPRDLEFRQRCRSMVLAGEQGGDLVRPHPALADQHAEHEGPRRLLAERMGGGRPAPQGVIDQRGDGGTVLRAGEAAGQPPILQGVRGGPAALDQIGQDLDGGADAGGGRHVRLPGIVLVGPRAVSTDSEQGLELLTPSFHKQKDDTIAYVTPIQPRGRRR